MPNFGSVILQLLLREDEAHVVSAKVQQNTECRSSLFSACSYKRRITIDDRSLIDLRNKIDFDNQICINDVSEPSPKYNDSHTFFEIDI